MKREHDTLGRRNRMRANSTGKRIRLTDRDETWLEAIHRHGPLSSSFLLAFAKSMGASEKRARERLGDLFHESDTRHGGAYLARPAQQFQTVDSRYNQLVYDIAPAGKRALTEAAKWVDRSGPSGGPWWHKFMVASITASIELATMQRDDLTFIPQAKILGRADEQLTTSIKYLDPTSRKMVTKNLCPDALFGLEYHTNTGSRFRFFALEADRATEPLTTSAYSRKSASRSFAQYQAYVEDGVYKRHLSLTAPLLVLNVTTSAQRCEKLVETLLKKSSGNAYMLFRDWCAFGAPPKIPKPNMSLLNQPWQRADHRNIEIDR